MAIRYNCCCCGRELNEPGALMIGVPNEYGMARKDHLCVHCATTTYTFLDNLRATIRFPPVIKL